MRYGILILLMVLLLAVQVPVFAMFGFGAHALDLALIATLYVASTSRPMPGFLTAIAFGVVADAFTPGGLLGMNMEILGAIHLVALGLVGRFNLGRAIPLIVVAFVLSILATLLFFLFSIVFDRAFTQQSTVFFWAVPRAAVTAAFAPLVFRLFGFVDRLLRGRRNNSPFLR
jgi:rod shape-determining protein MreD